MLLCCVGTVGEDGTDNVVAENVVKSAENAVSCAIVTVAAIRLFQFGSLYLL